MKARTKTERRVQELGRRLPAISEAKRKWAFSLFPKNGLYLKKGEVWCQCCGHVDRVLIPELAVSLAVGAHTCPHCGTTLTLKHHQRGMEAYGVVHTAVRGMERDTHLPCRPDELQGRADLLRDGRGIPQLGGR